MVYLTVPALRTSVPTGVLISSLGIVRGTVVVDNEGIFGVFLGILPFPQFIPLTYFTFQALPLHVISYSHSFISYRPSPNTRIGIAFRETDTQKGG